MATANCSITGFKYYNGGWLPSSGWSTASSNVSGYGGTSSSTGTTYTAVYQFTIPSVSGTVSSGTISFALPWIDGGYSSTFSVNYHITKTAPSTNASVQGTTVASGSISDTGSNSQQWKTKSFTTGAFNATTGTYYLYLTGGSMPAEFGGHLAATLNYSSDSSASTGSTFIKPTASKERDSISGTSWANYSYDSDCASYDGGNTIRIGGSNSSKNW